MLQEFNSKDWNDVEYCLERVTLREKRRYSEFFWSVFSRIRTEYGETRSIPPYSVRIRENTNQKNSEYGHFSSNINREHFKIFLK